MSKRFAVAFATLIALAAQQGFAGGFSSYSGGARSTYSAPSRAYTYTAPSRGYGSTAGQASGSLSSIYRGKAAAAPALKSPAFTLRSGTANLRPSTRPYDSEQQVAERVRNQMRFNGANNTRDYETSEGFLSPTFPNTVFSPVFFYLPWNIWHPRESLAQSNSSAEVPLSGGSDDRYEAGDIGAAEVNGLPEWAQASLRLTHTQKATGLPADPTLNAKGTLADEAKTRADLQTQNQKIAALNLEISNQAAIASAPTALKDLQAQLPDAYKDFDDAQKTNADIAQEVANASKDVDTAQANLEAAKNQNRLCSWTYGWFKSCTASEEAIVRDNLHRLQNASDKIANQETELNQRRARYEDLSSRIRTYQAEANQHLDTPAELERAKQDLAKSTEAVERAKKHLAELSGFLHADAGLLPSLKPGCGDPLEYKADPALAGNHHPFFSESVESELVPDGTLDLVVCLNSQGKLNSVYLLGENGKLAGSSQIQRDNQNAIVGIIVKDATDAIVEHHTWKTADNGVTRYALTFKRFVDPDSDESDSHNKEVSVYTDLNPDATVSVDR